MQELRDIPGIGKASFELLEAAGFRDTRSLARAGVEPLVNELQRANDILKIAKRAPARANIEKWILAAREAMGAEETAGDVDAADSVMPVDFEAMSEVAVMLGNAPCAIPFPGRWLAESRIPVADIVPGILLNRYAGDLEIRIEDRPPEPRNEDTPVRPPATQYVQLAEKPQQSRLEIDVTRVRRSGDPLPERLATTASKAAASPEFDEEDPASVLRTARQKTNAGRDRNSRRYIRGVLHSDPWRVRVGALVTLPLYLIIPAAIAASILLLLYDGNPEAYPWVRPWWVVFPFLVPVAGLGWLIWGHSCSCRICRQRLFIPSKHRKNIKAHHLPVLGYILPLCLHLLVFNWFRCTHCGTPVRLKK